MTERDGLPTGRLSRFTKLAGLAVRTAGTLGRGTVTRALGGDANEATKRAALAMLETLGTMKGVAMKVGQQLAMDPDALPPEARALVAKLFAEAPTVRFEEMAAVVKAELGAPPSELFATFDETPMASASLGQVYRATLRDGTPVAVKVQYPGVAEAIESDFRNGAVLATFADGALRSMADLEARPYYDEIRAEISREVDYTQEAQNGEDFARAARDFPELVVPRVYRALSSSKVLTQELVEGVRLDAFARSEAAVEARGAVTELLGLALLGPFVAQGLVHGDPHPGNFLAREDGRLAVLDFGAVKRLPPEFPEALVTLLETALAGREPDIVGTLSKAHYELRGDVARGTELLRRADALIVPIVREARYDWTRSTMVPDLRALFLEDLRAAMQLVPPPESLLLHRALSGLVFNARSLGGDRSLRGLAERLVRLRRSR